MSNPNWSEFVTETLRERRPKIAWNIFSNQILTYLLMTRGQVRKISGGASLVEPLIYGESSDITWFDGADPVGTTFTPYVSAAEYNYQFGAVPVTINFTDQWRNNGKAEVFNMLKTRTAIAERTWRSKLNTKLFTAAASSKEILGLPDLLEKNAVGAQTTSVGGISKATNTYWNNQYQDVAGAFGTNGIFRMEDLYLDASVGTSHPDIILGTRAFWQNYHRYIRTNQQVRHAGVPAELADTQFKALEFWGTPVVWDEDCPADTAYFLTTGGKSNKKIGGQDLIDEGKHSAEDIGHLRLAIHKDVNFLVTPAEKPVGQFSYVSHIVWGGALVCNNMGVQGVLDNVDTW